MSTELTPAMRRSSLIAMPRDRSMWPKDFVWNFNRCDRCAMMLAHEMLGVPADRNGNSPDHEGMGSALGMTVRQSWTVFAVTSPDGEHVRDGHRYNYPVNEYAVTPEMVADRLEQLHRELV